MTPDIYCFANVYSYDLEGIICSTHIIERKESKFKQKLIETLANRLVMMKMINFLPWPPRAI